MKTDLFSSGIWDEIRLSICYAIAFVKERDTVPVSIPNGMMQMYMGIGYLYFIVFSIEVPVSILMVVIHFRMVPVMNLIVTFCTGIHTESNDTRE